MLKLNDRWSMDFVSDTTRSGAVELAEMMAKSRRIIQKIIKYLVEECLIERIGSKKTGSWIVKNVGK